MTALLGVVPNSARMTAAVDAVFAGKLRGALRPCPGLTAAGAGARPWGVPKARQVDRTFASRMAEGGDANLKTAAIYEAVEENSTEAGQANWWNKYWTRQYIVETLHREFYSGTVLPLQSPKL